MLGRKKIYADKLLWRVMSDSGMKLNKSYDMAVAYLEGGSTYFVHDHVTAEKKFTFLHVDYKYAGYTREILCLQLLYKERLCHSGRSENQQRILS